MSLMRIAVLFTDRQHRTWGDGYLTLPAEHPTDERSLQVAVAELVSTSTNPVYPTDVYVYAYDEVA